MASLAWAPLCTKVLKYTSLSPLLRGELFKSLRQLQVFGLLLRNLVHKFRPRSTSASFASFIEKTSWMAQVLKLSITIIHSGLVAKRGNMLPVQRGAKLQKSKRAKLQKPTSGLRGQSIKLKNHNFHRTPWSGDWTMNTLMGKKSLKKCYSTVVRVRRIRLLWKHTVDDVWGLCWSKWTMFL